MSKDVVFWMTNIGQMTSNGKQFEVVENLTDKSINLFFILNKEVRSWRLSKSLVLMADGADLLTKTKNHWKKILNSSISEIEEPLSCQHYSISTWDLIQLLKKLKKGERYPFHLTCQ